MFRYLVLGLLRDGRAYHGYALMKAYRERSGVSISTGNFYRELQRLVGEGLVQTAPVEPGEDVRRAPYQITELGLAAFESWVLTPPTHIGSYDDELSSRAVFIGDIDPALALRLLDRWREAIWMHGKALERDRESSVLNARPGIFDARSLLLARRLKHVAADLEFIEEIRNACAPPAPIAAPVEEALVEAVVAPAQRTKRKVAAPSVSERKKGPAKKSTKGPKVSMPVKAAAKVKSQKKKQRK